MVNTEAPIISLCVVLVHLNIYIQIKVGTLNLVLKETCKLLGIKKTRTTPYHPQSDGMIERFKRTLLTICLAAAEDENSTTGADASGK